LSEDKPEAPVVPIYNFFSELFVLIVILEVPTNCPLIKRFPFERELEGL